MASNVEVAPQVLEAMRQGERDKRWLEGHPEVLEPYRGQWVVVFDQRVIAHSPDGGEAARAGDARIYPGVLLLYVPTREEAGAVHIL